MYVVYCFQLNTLEQKVYELFEKTFINRDGEFSYFYFWIYVHIAHPNGRICGAKRPKCEDKRSVLKYAQ